MKRWLAMLLVLALCLSLAACGDDLSAEEQEKIRNQVELYEKYEDIILALEEQDYAQVISQVGSLSHAQKEANKETLPAAGEYLCDTWYSYYENSAVKELTFEADGTCKVDGKAMTWTETQVEETYVSGYVMDQEDVKYVFTVNAPNESRAMPCVYMYTAKAGSNGYNGDESVGSFTNHEHVPAMMQYWRQITPFEEFPSSISPSFGNVSILNDYCMWSVTDTTDGLMTAHAVAQKGEAEYTLTYDRRDGFDVLYVTSNSTEAKAMYYADLDGDVPEYDHNWPEALYSSARRDLDTYLIGNSIRSEDGTKYLSGNDALGYIYERFSKAGDYMDSAEYLARFTVLEDRLTKIQEVRVNMLDQVSRNDAYICKYNADGTLASEKGNEVEERYGIANQENHFTYADDGKLAEIWTGYNRKQPTSVSALTYDEAGNLTGIVTQTGTSAYSANFTYDDAGRRIGAHTNIGQGSYYESTYTYTYNGEGLMTRWERSTNEGRTKHARDYTYENGALTKIAGTCNSYSTTYTYEVVFTNDAQGRPISAQFTTTKDGYNYKSTVYEYTYENVYFLNGEDLAE